MLDKRFDTPEAKEILSKRAKIIAKEKQELGEQANTNILLFQLGSIQQYALAYSVIEKVIDEQKITTVPAVNPLFIGVFYYNSEIWPVVNLNLLLHCHEPNKESNFILLRKGEHRYALACGTIIGQKPYDDTAELIHLATENSAFLLGIYHGDVAVIDIEAIFEMLGSISVCT